MIFGSPFLSGTTLANSSIGGTLSGSYPGKGGVTVATQPAQQRIAVFSLSTGELVRWTRSWTDGSFTVNFIPPGEYFLVAFDSNKIFRPTISKIVTPSSVN